MHNNYYLIRQLVPELRELIIDSILIDCFSQNKNELVFRFTKDQQEQIVIAHLDPTFTCLSFPEKFNKARKNTAQIFTTVINGKVSDVRGFENERAILIIMDDGWSVLLKLYGHQANVVLYNKDDANQLFRGNLKRDFKTKLSELDRPLDHSRESIIGDLPQLKKVLPTLDRRSRLTLIDEIDGLTESKAYDRIINFIKQLEAPSKFSIYKEDSKFKLTLLNVPESETSYSSPSEALTHFFRLYLGNYSLDHTKSGLLKSFKDQYSKSEAYIKKTGSKLDEIKNKTSYKEMADILMANLHLLKANCSSADLLNFYSNKIISIKLNPRLNPQQNAEKYYKKGKNVSIEISKLEEAIISKQQFLKTLKKNIETVETSTSVAELKKFIKYEKLASTPKSLPYKNFNIEGFTVLVGKNAKQNDILTLKIAKKEDIFFHAKDVSGSHVILKIISGQSISASVMEQTAALAAYYSKRKTDTLCPVGYTKKKYVRKPKGSVPGLVIVENEKVLLVEPKLPNN